MATPIDKEKVYRDFSTLVNMTAPELKAWLHSDESRSVGQKKEGAVESTGHASGRKILAIMAEHKDDLKDEDYAHMRKVIGYIRRHKAQEPENTVTSRWRYSLMNWGHDPLK